MVDFIDPFLAERRTLQQAVADLRVKYDLNHATGLADMIRNGEAEILDRANRPDQQPVSISISRLRRSSPDRDLCFKLLDHAD